MAKKSTHSRIERLDQISALLKSDTCLTVQRLAQELGVSVRTISRDIELLRDRGYPIEADRGRGGGIQLHRNWGVGRVNLELAEAIDLLISLAVAEKMNSPFFFGKLPSLRNKVLASFSTEMKNKLRRLRSRILVGFPASLNMISNFKPRNDKHINKVHRAFLELKTLDIRYTDMKSTTTDRTIEPHYLYLHYPVWYLVAWDHLRQDIRHFRIDRIERARILDTEFVLGEKRAFTKDLELFADPV
jgi:predicted DNA-binding transcriptional regulator YafY